MSQGSMLRGSDRFRIEREIADTLQGRIYAGTDLLTQKAVVIKEAWRQLVHSGRSRKGHRVPEDFLKERKLIMSLTSLPDCTPGLVRGIAEWDDEHCYYYAMEFCEGELFDYISSTHTRTDYRQFVDTESKKEQKPMKRPNKWVINVAKMFKQICEAVHWLHLKGYCHLDLSLENTMISDLKNLKVKIIDLGLTQKFNNNDYRFQGRVGKLQYMCPEAYNRKVYNAKKADVYCLGVMLFMMLIGAPPYQAPQSQNAAFTYFVSGRAGDVLKHWKRLRLITEDALDLLNNMLRYENNRMTLDQILQHPFFTNLDETDEQLANPMQIEEKNDTNIAVPSISVDKISSDVSQMSLVEDDDNKEKEKEKEKDNNNNNNRNMWCEMLLQEWGLEEISPILHSSGWNDPKQWNQLTLYALKFEIGLNDKQSSLFINHIKHQFGQQQNKCNVNYNNNNNNNNMNVNNRPNRANQQKRQKQQKQQKYRPNQRNYHQQQRQPYRQNQHQQQRQPYRPNQRNYNRQQQQQQPPRQHNPHNRPNRQNHNQHPNHPNPYSQYNNNNNNNNNNNDNANDNYNDNDNDDNNDNDNDNDNDNNPNNSQHPNPH